MTTNIYVLKLKGGKYYVGKSNDPMSRYEEHLTGSGSSWTRKYKPIGVEKIISNCSPFDEDKVTKEMMAKYGIENVRGGAYVTESLDEIQEEALRREIWGAQDRCTACGRKGHFVANCYARTDVEGNELEYESDSDSESIPAPVAIVKKVVAKQTHAIPVAIVKKVVAKQTQAIPVPDLVPARKKVVAKKNVCYRCGRDSHYANECYAQTHVSGKYLDDSDDSGWYSG
jgi:predicted GIY-YIG superfamily endonuclease